MTESLLLAAMGGGAGLLLAWWLVEALKAAPPPPGALPITPEFALDVRVLIFTLGLSVTTGIVFGLAPALRASRPDLVPALKDESFVLDERTRRLSLRNILVVAQVALSLVLLIAAGLFLRSFQHAQSINPGFDAAKLLTVQLNINLLRYARPQGRVLVAIGAGFGLTLAVIATSLLASFLYGISATDGITFAAIPMVLALVSFLACYLPARRATNVDPMIALRSE